MRVAVLGAGAVGCYFGAQLAKGGVPVTLVGRAAHVEAILARGLTLHRDDTMERIVLDASTDVAACAAADIVLLCVKSGDTESAAAELRPHLGTDAIVVSMQNGVDNAERAAAVLGRHVVPAVVYVGAEMAGPGEVRHLGRGDLVLQEGDAAAARFASVAVGAGVPCTLVEDVTSALWQKLVINCAYNPVSALARQPYGALLQDEQTRRLMRALASEAIAVGQQGGVRLDGKVLLDGLWRIGEAMPGQYSSTAQDLERGRRTEIDSLNGFVARRGEALGVPVPCNATVAALIALREQAAPR